MIFTPYAYQSLANNDIAVIVMEKKNLVPPTQYYLKSTPIQGCLKVIIILIKLIPELGLKYLFGCCENQLFRLQLPKALGG